MIMCPNLKNPDVAREFNELKEATSEQAAYHIWSLNNGNAIDKAPNGAESKLFYDLLKLFNGDRTAAIQAKARIYSQSFLNWFGDWINDPTNASKVVDENGEPLVVYRGGNIKDGKLETRLGGYYFTPSKEYADTYRDLEGGETHSFFINAKSINSPKNSSVIIRSDGKKVPFRGLFEMPFYEKDIDIVLDGKEAAYSQGEYLVKNLNQVKSATGNNGDFSSDNIHHRNIRMQQYITKKTFEKYDNLTAIHADNMVTSSDGSELTAPNGKPSNLPRDLYYYVRTSEFKEWFGDWENDPEHSSKIIDENGEPLIVYHGNEDENITTFGIKDGRFNKKGGGIYFTPSSSVAHTYTTERENADKYIIKGFNAPEIYEDSYYDYLSYEEYKKSSDYKSGKIYTAFLNLRNPVTGINPQTPKQDVLKRNPNADGFISYNVIDNYKDVSLHTDLENELYGTKQIIVFDQSQIKLVTSSDEILHDRNIEYQEEVNEEQYKNSLKSLGEEQERKCNGGFEELPF